MLVKVVSFYVVSGGGGFSFVVKDGFNVGIVFFICNGIIKIVIFILESIL